MKTRTWTRTFGQSSSYVGVLPILLMLCKAINCSTEQARESLQQPAGDPFHMKCTDVSKRANAGLNLITVCQALSVSVFLYGSVSCGLTAVILFVLLWREWSIWNFSYLCSQFLKYHYY